MKSNPFELHRPSVFVVGSPFQALCAIAAIRQLEIHEYKMVAVFTSGQIRNKQLRHLLDDKNLKYQSIPLNKFTNQIFKYLSLIKLPFRKYNRLFLPDIRDIKLLQIGCCFAKGGADVIYTDDGSASICILQGSTRRIHRADNSLYLRRLVNGRKFVFNKNLLTIYYGIENPNYNIEVLDFRNLLADKKFLTQSGVFIVGTYIDSYIGAVGIERDFFITHFSKLCRNIKDRYPGEKIVYIPHGRDESLYAQKLCGELGFEFRRPEVSVELELIQLPSEPLAIYGFTSSALFNLKIIFPMAEVVDAMFEFREPLNSCKEDRLGISAYYRRCGIKTYLLAVV